MEKYYYFENETKNGPFSISELLELKLPADTLICKEGTEDFLKIENILGDVTENTVENEAVNFLIDKNNTLQAPEMIEQSPNYAGFCLRFAAFLIDYAIVFLTLKISECVIMFTFSVNPHHSFQFLLPIIAILLNWLYFSLFESSKYQATPGKLLVKLKVTDDNYNKISFAKATGRHFSKILSGLIFGIGFLLIILNDNKKGLHDIIAGTLVLKEKKLTKINKIFLFILLTIPISIFSYFIYTSTYSWVKGFKNESTASYAGITFDYPSKWIINNIEVKPNYSFNIRCIKSNSIDSDEISILKVKEKLDLQEQLRYFITNIKINKDNSEQFKNYNITFTDIATSKFLKYDAFHANFELINKEKQLFGKITAFHVGEMTILIIKQTDKYSKLNTEFTTVENSLKFE